jgi:DNA-binding response OmpR family regulator
MAKFENILLVEDDVFISELYVRALKRAGYNVTSARSGPEGLEKGKSGSFDLMLLDIMIPDMTGVEVLQAMRAEKDMAPNMKIVITTNLEQDEETRKSVESLADGYIIKADVTPKHLLSIIKKIEETGMIPAGI